MEEVLKQLNELCRDTLVDNLGMVFTAAGEGWLEARMPIDRRTCRPDGALHGGANMALAETVGGALSSMPTRTSTSLTHRLPKDTNLFTSLITAVTDHVI